MSCWTYVGWFPNPKKAGKLIFKGSEALNPSSTSVFLPRTSSTFRNGFKVPLSPGIIFRAVSGNRSL